MSEENNGIQILSPEETPAATEDNSSQENQETVDVNTDTDDNSDDDSASSSNDFEGIKIMSPEELSATETTTDDKTVIENPDENESGTEAKTEAKKTETKVNVSTEKKAAILTALAKEMSEKGILDELPEDFDGSIESLRELFDSNINNKAEANVEKYKNNFSGSKKRFLEIEDAFTDEAVAIRVAQDLEFFNTVSDDQIEDDEKVQEVLYGRLLQSKGFTNDQITEAIDEAKTLGKLTEKAKAAHPLLKKGAEEFVNKSRENKKEQEKIQEENRTKSFNELLTSIDERDSIIKDLPFTKTHKDKLKATISDIAYTDEKTGNNYTAVGYKQHKNPKEFEVLLSYYENLGLFNMDEKTGKFTPDLTKIKTVAKSQATKELDEIIADDSINISNKTNLNGQLEGEEHSKSIIDLLKKGGFNK